MHAQRIIQDLLDSECPSIHAKRRKCVAAIADAGSKGSLSLMGISRCLNSDTDIRHRIKRCDRLLGNSKLGRDRQLIYGAMARRVLRNIERPLIVIDWSDVRADRSQQLLRAALIVQGRALTLYEEVHPIAKATALDVHRAFLKTLKRILPSHCNPVFVTDAGFRSTWFKLLNNMVMRGSVEFAIVTWFAQLVPTSAGMVAKCCIQRQQVKPKIWGNLNTFAITRLHVAWS